MGAIEKAVDVAVDVGLDALVEPLERIGGGLLFEADFEDCSAGAGEALSDDVDMDNERRVVPKAWVGEGKGNAANEVRFWTFSPLRGDTGFLIVVTAKGDIASNIAWVSGTSSPRLTGFESAPSNLVIGPVLGVLWAVGLG